MAQEDKRTDMAAVRAAVERYVGGAAEDFSIRAALIDMDGVLYDSMKYHTLAWERMMREAGVECTRDEFYLYEGMTGAATIKMLFEERLGKQISDEECKRLYAFKTQYFIDFGKREPMPGADRMLRALIRAGVKRVLVTGSGQKSLLSYLSRDYPGAFSEALRVTASDVKHGKPAPEPYLMGLAKAEEECRNTIVIENAPLGVKSGHAAGCFTIAVTTGPIPEAEMWKAGADLVFPSMPAFADALPEILALYPPKR